MHCITHNWLLCCTGEYWLAKAQSNCLDLSSVCGIVDHAKYVPRRTSQRRISAALSLSLDSATANKHSAHPYSPFLSPTTVADRGIAYSIDKNMRVRLRKDADSKQVAVRRSIRPRIALLRHSWWMWLRW